MRTITGNTRKEELEKLTASNRRLLYMTIMLVGLAAAALITALFKAMLPSVLFLAAMFLARITLHRKARSDYRQAITEAALVCSVGAKMDAFTLSKTGGTGITKEQILAAEIYPARDNSPDSIGLYQGISGISKEMDISLNDITISQYKSAGQKGADVACGVFMHFCLPKDTGLDLRILSKEILPDDIRKEFFKTLPRLTKQSADAAGLDNTLLLYGASPELSALPPSFIPSVNNLARKCTGNLAISLRGASLDFFFKNRVLAPAYNLNMKPDEKILQFDPIPEFKDALNLAKKL